MFNTHSMQNPPPPGQQCALHPSGNIMMMRLCGETGVRITAMLALTPGHGTPTLFTSPPRLGGHNDCQGGNNKGDER